MTRDDFLDKQYHLSVTAGMNQRYHQEKADYWANRDAIAKIATAVFATAGVVMSIVTIYNTETWAITMSVFVALVAAAGAFILNVFPFGTRELHHRDLLRRWSDMREEVDALEFILSDEKAPSKDLVQRLKELDAKTHRICGTENSPDKKLLGTCYREEELSRKEPENSCAPQAA
jgi:hypothetical protein